MNNFLQHKEKWLVAVAANIHEWFPVAVAVALARYFNSKTEEAFPSVDTLAEELDTDRRNTQRALDRLVKAEWLSVPAAAAVSQRLPDQLSSHILRRAINRI